VRLFDKCGGHPELLDKMALAMVLKAQQGDVAAFNAVADRMDGKVPQAIGGDNELDPIGIIITGVPRDGDPE
jgi:hypothetical protein